MSGDSIFSPLVITLIVVGVILLIIICRFIAISNNVNRLKLKVDESLSGVEIMLRQRYDILMQGKSVAEQYAKHEQQVFENLRSLSQVPNHATVEQLNEASREQEQAMNGIFALGEAYPELKSAELFNNLINQLSEQNQQYSASRRAVNGNITKLNNYVVSFPSSLVCSMKGVTKMDYIHEENVNQLKDINMNMNL